MILRKGYGRFFGLRRFCTEVLLKTRSEKKLVDDVFQVPEPEYNVSYLCDPSNRDVIFNNIKKRKGAADIDKILELSRSANSESALLTELGKIPNLTDPRVLEYGEEPRMLKEHGQKPEFDFDPKEFAELTKKLKLIKTDTLGPLTGQRGYMFFGDLADLEETLIRHTIDKLGKHKFKLISVPDIIPTQVVERCGLIVDGERTLVYSLDSRYGNDLSLSGTAEMSLAARLMNTEFTEEELPAKFAAVSRCYRAETSSTSKERGIYRVHQFTKVEMFACSTPRRSEEMFEELRAIQEEIFSSLGLHYRVMDMPPHELGAPAYRKIDIEAWMPGKRNYGELSSCSNCTDYQSRRLNIKYRRNDGATEHVHTLNGTACATPRTLIALCETYQTKHARITVPECLVSYMRGKTLIRKQSIPDTRTCKYKQSLNEN